MHNIYLTFILESELRSGIHTIHLELWRPLVAVGPRQLLSLLTGRFCLDIPSPNLHLLHGASPVFGILLNYVILLGYMLVVANYANC